MRIDLYTKTVLTVIAGCLIWISINQTLLTRPVAAQAAAHPQPVVIAGVSAPIPVVNPRGEPLTVATGRDPLAVAAAGNRSIPVSLSPQQEAVTWALPVRVVGIAKATQWGFTWDPVEVIVKDAPTKQLPR